MNNKIATIVAVCFICALLSGCARIAQEIKRLDDKITEVLW